MATYLLSRCEATIGELTALLTEVFQFGREGLIRCECNSVRPWTSREAGIAITAVHTVSPEAPAVSGCCDVLSVFGVSCRAVMARWCPESGDSSPASPARL
jgi:hypothetical protein